MLHTSHLAARLNSNYPNKKIGELHAVYLVYDCAVVEMKCGDADK
jgi:hypothetical protein